MATMVESTKARSRSMKCSSRIDPLRIFWRVPLSYSSWPMIVRKSCQNVRTRTATQPTDPTTNRNVIDSITALSAVRSRWLTAHSSRVSYPLPLERHARKTRVRMV